MKDNRIEDRFELELGDKLRGFREEPPAGMFERIEKTLAATGVASVASPTATSTPDAAPAPTLPLWSRGWFRAIAATSAAAVVVVAVLLGVRSGEQEGLWMPDEVVCSNILTLDTPMTMVAKPKLPLVSGASVDGDVHSSTPKVDLALATTIPAEPTKEELSLAATLGATEPTIESSRNQTDKSRQTTKSRRSRSENRDTSKWEEYWRSVIAEEESNQERILPTEIGVYMAGGGVTRGNVRMDNVAHSQMFVQEHNSVAGEGFLGPVMVNQQKTTKLEHSIPLTIGVTARFPLTDWLSLESGLLYTRLSSHSESSGLISSYELRRSMDYLGVPLAFSLRMADVGRVGIYGRVGVTGELLISAQDSFYLDGRFNRTEQLSEARLVTVSLDAAAGVDMWLWGGVSLFGEVGCSYWQAPANYPENYRTIHPLSFDLRFGLKYTFN